MTEVDRTVNPTDAALSRLFDLAVSRLDVNNKSFALAVGLSEATAKRRLAGKSGWSVREVMAAAAFLGISADQIADILFPKRQVDAVRAGQMRSQLASLEKENADLRAGRFESQVFIRDVLESGDWAISVIPVKSGPTPDREVLTSYRFSVAPMSEQTQAESVEEWRKRLTFDAPTLLHRSIVLAGTPMNRPAIPGIRGKAGDRAFDLAVSSFEVDSGETNPEKLQYSGNGVLVVSSTVGAWGPAIASLIARSLGWSHTNTRNIARATEEIQPGSTSEERRAWLTAESASQLRNILFERRSDWSVTSHWGTAEFSEGGMRHPLVTAIASAKASRDFPELPFIVLLRESDDLIDEYGDAKYQDGQLAPDGRAERMRATRDRLYDSILEGVPSSSRKKIDVPRLESSDPVERAREGWMRSVRIAHQVIELLAPPPVGPIRYKDRDAALMMGAVSPRT